jgi:MoxR-like ATPase
VIEFTTDALEAAARQRGLVFPRAVLSQVVAALDAGKHIMLTGAPGTGKTSLAYLVADLAKAAVLCTGFMAVTASSDWDVGETVGRYAQTPEGAAFQPGVFLQSIQSGRWLVIDELNRADFDRAFGPLFTVLSGQAVTLPFKQAGHTQPLAIVPAGAEAPADADPIRVPGPWRLLATMNEFDKQTLYRLSYALMRRFAFIEVEAGSDEMIRELVAGAGGFVAELLPVRQFLDLGPAVFMDAARYAARRAEDRDASRSRVLFECFYSYLLPQLDRLGDRGARDLFDALVGVFEPPELSRLRRALEKVLGAGPGPASEPPPSALALRGVG